VSRLARDLIEYFDDALPFLLETEVETTARAWVAAYNETLARVAEWIEGRVDLPSKKLTPRELAIAEKGIARAYARRVFRLTSEAIDGYHHPLLPWKNILKRSRELMQEEVARDRRSLRERVLYALAAFFGLPLNKAEERVDGLLCQYFDPVPRDLDLERELLQSIKDEFDVELLPAPTDDLRNVESILSLVQRSLEAESGRAHRIRIIETQSAQFEEVLALHNEFEYNMAVADEKKMDHETLMSYLRTPQPDATMQNRMLVATYQVRIMCGFVMLTAKDGICRLERLYVNPKVRRHGIGAQLVRRALEEAAHMPFIRRVLFNSARFSQQRIERIEAEKLVQREGFVKADSGDDFEYALRPEPNASVG